MTIELCGANLKLKYRSQKPRGTQSSSTGTSGSAKVRGEVPRGLRRRPKGRCRCP
jgi:hypothetical protein